MEAPDIQHFRLSYQQENLWEKIAATSIHPVHQLAWKMTCANESTIRKAFETIVPFVEQLRVFFEKTNERRPVQTLGAPRYTYLAARYPVQGNDCRDDILRRLEQVRHECMAGGELIAGHLELPDNVFVLHLTVPGLVADVCSLAWLLNAWVGEIRRPVTSESFTYEGLQYLDYSEWQRDNARCVRPAPMENSDELLPIESFQTTIAHARMRYDVISAEINNVLKGEAFNGAEEKLLFYAWYTLISKLSRLQKIEVGYNCTGRKASDLQPIFGLIEKTIPFVSKTSTADTSEAIKEIEGFLDAIHRHIIDFGGEVDWSRHTFGHCFSYIDLREYSLLEGELFFLHQELNATGLQLTCVRHFGGLDLCMLYDAERYEAPTIARLALSLQSMLSCLSVYSSGELILKPLPAEKKAIEECLSNLPTSANEMFTVIDRIKLMAESFPDNIAIAQEGRQIDYRMFWNTSAKLAYFLINEYQVQRGDVVALDMHRSPELLIGMLSVLQAGAAYLVLDPRWPEERKQFIVKNSEARITINLALFNAFSVEEFKMPVGKLLEAPVSVDGKENAYLIYTSGTTGHPKGVFIRHESLANYANSIAVELKVTPDDKTLLFASLAFDLCYTAFWSALTSGATVVLHEDEHFLNAAKLVEDLSAHSITYIKLTPTHFSLLVAALADNVVKLDKLRLVIFGGEKLHKRDVEKFLFRYPAIKFVNHYGPTETTVGCLIFPFDGSTHCSAEFGDIIGKPIKGNRIYIADERGICSMGEWGEIWIAGRSVASGYWNSPDLSVQKFPVNPFTNDDALRHIYRTGDRGRLLHNGLVQFGGRLDDQIKINGFRIEPGEITHQLTRMPEVDRALVLTIEHQGVQKLVACITVNSAVKVMQIKKRLKDTLPSPCVPDEIFVLEAFPVKAHGKVDLWQLQQIITDRWNASAKVSYSLNDRGAMLRRVWSDVLNVEQPKETDNFFEAGGDSIKAIRMMALMGQQGYELDINVIFREQSLEKIEPWLVVKNTTSVQELITASYTLTPIQQWLFTQPIDQKLFVQTVTLHLDHRIGRNQLSSIMDRIMRHHDGMRLKVDVRSSVGHITSVDGSYVLKEFTCAATGATETELKDAWELLAASLDLQDGPLVAVGVFQHAASTVCFVVHHLVVDAISWKILLEDFSMLLQSELTGIKNDLPLKTDSYAQWSNSLNQYMETVLQSGEVAYWNDVTSNSIQYFDACANVKPHRQKIVFQSTAENTQSLVTVCNKSFNTETVELILAALCLAISDISGRDSVYICMEGHGRVPLGKINITRTVGWFSTLYPFFIQLPPAQTVAESIIEVKERFRRIPAKGIGFGLLKYSTPGTFGAVEPQIRLNYFGEISGGGNDFSFRVGAQKTDESNLSTFPIDVVAFIFEQRLTVEVGFNASLVNFDFAQALSEQTKTRLIKIIDVCANATDSIKTPSDFDYKALSIRDLENLFD